jgi:NAD(P)H-dependent flavin oxidoreductase YrpB (nitropropane dioxygenase family)
MIAPHTFHIPVMGTAFTADSPIKVAHYGINTVVALADDVLLERLRKYYSGLNNLSYKEIKNDTKDYRADRITAYLNMVKKITSEKFEEFTIATQDKFLEVKKYFAMLPDTNKIKKEFNNLIVNSFSFDDLSAWLKENLFIGSIDVNIMTKVDKKNYFNKEELPSEYNDAHAGLRGYANSDLASSVIFSAGMNPRLYGYIAQFDDFFPDKNGYIKKKIILKVSDYRSAVIQGKFLAKKGLWVSEYRIESGLNCGGHAFATDGHLMGPILAEFRDRRQELVSDTYTVCKAALEINKKTIPEEKLGVKITAQGGVATAEEHNFLINHYELDTVGWGTPFLLVPEATTVDTATRKQLQEAKEKDLYLSNVSPLGVPFNNLRNSSKDIEKFHKIEEGKPGSPCPRKFLALSNEYGTQGVCTASRLFQKNKIEEQGISDTITEKTCLCMGLAATAVINYGVETRESKGVSICPGPNMAYFNQELTLQDMSYHIYNGNDGIVRADRPNMFVNELGMYLTYLSEKIEEHKNDWGRKSGRYLNTFTTNMNEGITYYQGMFNSVGTTFSSVKDAAYQSLNDAVESMKKMGTEIDVLIEENQK